MHYSFKCGMTVFAKIIINSILFLYLQNSSKFFCEIILGFVYLKMTNLLRRRAAIRAFFRLYQARWWFHICDNYRLQCSNWTNNWLNLFDIWAFFFVVWYSIWKQTAKEPGSFQQIDDYLLVFVWFSEIYHSVCKLLNKAVPVGTMIVIIIKLCQKFWNWVKKINVN